MRTSARDVRMYEKQKQEKPSMLSLISMEHEILGDTDLETIVNDFVCKKFGVMKLFATDFFSKSTLKETRATSISSFLNILCSLTTLQLLFSALM